MSEGGDDAASMSEPLVSIFANAYAKTPSTIGLRAVLSDIKGGRYARQIVRLRKMCPADYSKNKTWLPAFTISGTCIDRKTPGVHSGLLQIDLDHVEAIPELRGKLKADPHVVFGFISPSGDGLKLGLAIDGKHHAECFNAAESYFDQTYKVVIDPKVKDRLRLCFVSHDPELWINDTPQRLEPIAQSSTEQTEVIKGLCYSVKEHPCYSVQSLEQAVALSIPTALRRNNRCLFRLARALKALDANSLLSPAERMAAFSQWYEQTNALGFLRLGQDREHYLKEFMNALKIAKHPLGESPIDAAWRKVQTEPMPQEAALFDAPETKQIVSLCYHLEKASTGQPWYLSCREASRLVGLSFRTCAQWLSGFVALGILTIAEPGTKQRATRYHWKGGTNP
jgi:hypothetical protein